MGEISQRQAIKELLNHSNSGGAIVPLLGAGISIESGIPSLGDLAQHLARVQGYIRKGLYRTRRRNNNNFYERKPDQYIHDFGWPDYHQLNSDLWHIFESEEKRSARSADVNGHHGRGYRQSLSGMVEEELLINIQRLDSRVYELLRESKQPINLQGNYWKSLLAHLTRSNPDYVDTFFQRLVKARQPGLAHRYLAFLTPILGIRLFLTLNFDDLLERSLKLEGLQPTVYEVSQDLILPHPALVEENLSVLKLHGGAFGLRVGEKLDMPLDAESRERLGDYVPDHAILLVMGLGGWDLRVLDLVELVARRKDSRVFWLHFEDKKSLEKNPVYDLAGSYGDSLQFARVRQPGAFLVDLHGLMTCSHPVSRLPYKYLDHQPIPMEEQKDTVASKVLEGKHIVVFRDQKGDDGFGAALALSEFVASKAGTHRAIWIDLEAMYTVSDVVVEIFRQLRQYDASLPQVVLADSPQIDMPALDESSKPAWKKYAKAIGRIFHALSRGRYILAFNGVGSFGRPPTSHHGLEGGPKDLSQDERQDFLEALFYAAHHSRMKECITEAKFPRDFQERYGWLRDSILAFAVDLVRFRRATDGVVEQHGSFYKSLRKYRSKIYIELEAKPSAPGDKPEGLQDALLLLTAFRRRRSFAALHRLLPIYLAKETKEGRSWKALDKSIADALQKLEDSHFIMRVEGGHYWMPRRLRDRLYDEIGQEAQSGKIRASLHDGKDSPQVRLQVKQLAELSTVHNVLADYHFDLFHGSHDSGALFEHLYHRISCIRYLTKLDALASISDLRHLKEDCPRLFRYLLHGADSVDPTDIRKVRLEQITNLTGVIERQQEAMLGLSTTGALIEWIKCVQRSDLNRFQVDKYLERVSDPDVLERQIKKLVKGLQIELEDFHGKVLLDRSDFLNCLRLRTQWISERLGVRWELGESPTLEQLAEWWRPKSKLYHRAQDLVRRNTWTVRDREHLLNAFMDVSSCVRWLERPEITGPHDLAGELLNAWKTKAEASDENVARAESRRMRQMAEQELAPLGPWEMKGASDGGFIRWQERCKQTIAYCQEGLERLTWVRGGESAQARSYFHSLKGRAHYLLGEFHEAHRELDLAGMGLATTDRGDREMHAIRLLRLAECLMVRADDVIFQCCLKSLNGRHYGIQRSFEERLSAEGRFHWIWPHVAEEFRQLPDQRWLRRAAKLYIARLANPDSRVLDSAEHWVEEQVHKLRGQGVDRVPLDDFCARFTEDWYRRQCEAISVNQAQKILARSLVYWPRHQLVAPEELATALARARGRLLRARDVLDQAESFLVESRNSPEWWSCLYQLRAKLQVERMLLLLTGDEWPLDPSLKRQHIARFTALLMEGLYAIRQGLDLVLPAQSTTPQAIRNDRRVKRLLRIWVEMAVCGSLLTRLTGENSRDVRPDKLLENWRDMNRRAKIYRLQKSLLIRRLNEVVNPPKEPGIESRVFMMTTVHEALHADIIDSLIPYEEE